MSVAEEYKRPSLTCLGRSALSVEAVQATPLIVSESAISLLNLLLSESLLLRRQQWEARNVLVDSLTLEEMRLIIRLPVRSLLQVATASAQERGDGEILACDVAFALSAKWCKVWPFCASA